MRHFTFISTESLSASSRSVLHFGVVLGVLEVRNEADVKHSAINTTFFFFRTSFLFIAGILTLISEEEKVNQSAREFFSTVDYRLLEASSASLNSRNVRFTDF